MHDLPSQIALAAAAMAGVAGWIVSLFVGASILVPLASALVVGIGTHAVVRRLITDRLGRVDSVLRELRREGGRTDEVTDQGDEIDRLIRTADQAGYAVRKRMTRLSRAESYRREYVGDVSHEIKTPIFAIQGFAETLLGGALEDPEVNRGFVEKILHHAARLNILARDLAEISRLETGALKLVLEPVRTMAVFEEVRESLEHQLRKKGVKLDIDVAIDAEWVNGDRERLRQVVTNLADNAVKYNNAGGGVRLRARREADRVRWIVDDDGIGISEEDLARVTERFFRADKSRSRAQGGTGLGLSIVKHILAAHGTNLNIESTLGVGSTFSFELPAASSEGGSAQP